MRLWLTCSLRGALTGGGTALPVSRKDRTGSRKKEWSPRRQVREAAGSHLRMSTAGCCEHRLRRHAHSVCIVPCPWSRRPFGLVPQHLDTTRVRPSKVRGLCCLVQPCSRRGRTLGLANTPGRRTCPSSSPGLLSVLVGIMLVARSLTDESFLCQVTVCAHGPRDDPEREPS